MSFEVMLRQLTVGFGQTCLIFFLTLIFSLPLGMVVYFGRVCRNQAGQLACENLHIDHARNAADAAAPRMVFWSVLFVGDEYRRI